MAGAGGGNGGLRGRGRSAGRRAARRSHALRQARPAHRQRRARAWGGSRPPRGSGPGHSEGAAHRRRCRGRRLARCGACVRGARCRRRGRGPGRGRRREGRVAVVQGRRGIPRVSGAARGPGHLRGAAGHGAARRDGRRVPGGLKSNGGRGRSDDSETAEADVAQGGHAPDSAGRQEVLEALVEPAAGDELLKELLRSGGVHGGAEVARELPAAHRDAAPHHPLGKEHGQLALPGLQLALDALAAAKPAEGLGRDGSAGRCGRRPAGERRCPSGAAPGSAGGPRLVRGGGVSGFAAGTCLVVGRGWASRAGAATVARRARRGAGCGSLVLGVGARRPCRWRLAGARVRGGGGGG
mmetsp:Transcript_19721/g.75728  ORF Transcript_19721/g.75728 Transcript_19721/m.75728 type:complete len:354 (+) Transcript_19721:1406-2467(+)